MNKKKIIEDFQERFKKRKFPSPTKIKFKDDRIIFSFEYNISQLILNELKGKNLSGTDDIKEDYIDECEENFRKLNPPIL